MMEWISIQYIMYMSGAKKEFLHQSKSVLDRTAISSMNCLKWGRVCRRILKKKLTDNTVKNTSFVYYGQLGINDYDYLIYYESQKSIFYTQGVSNWVL